MKKRFAIISVVLAVLLLAGCSSAPKAKVYDTSVPLEQSSTLIISESCSVSEFNGVKTGKDWSSFTTFTPVEKQVVIPAGTHTLKLHYTYYVTTGSGWNLSATTTGQFLPGHIYVVAGYRDTLKSDARLFIFDETEYNRELAPNPASPNATQFEGIWVNTRDAEKRLVFADNQFFYTEKDGKVLSRGMFDINGQTVNFALEFSRDKKGYRWIPAKNERQEWKQLEFNGTTLTDISGSILNPSIGTFRRAE
jgi:uncharacterized protein YcfL